MNWGRAVNDDWLEHNLLYTPPPTSDGYLAPIVAYDDPEPVRDAIDELAAEITEKIVIHLGLHNGDYYTVLVEYYPHLMIRRRLNEGASIAALSRHMHCSRNGAERMLIDAVARYWDYRQTARKTA